MWHTWTLDPLATGLVLVAVWEYTKLIPYFEKDSKVYEFKISLNWTTPSFDSETEINFLSEDLQEKYKNELTLDKIEKILKEKFTWKIIQLPPKYSALKVWWKKALDMVRDWVDFELKEREVEIFSIEILSYNYPEVFLRASVSAWTYIRSIANDLWNILWTWWYITYLRRVWIWNLDLSLSQKLDDFDVKWYLDIEKLFWKNKFITMDEEILSKINNWLKVEKEISLEKWDYFIKSDENIVTNIVNYDWNLLIPKRKI
jgi:tRNA pseudouridine55 synthase